MKIRSKAGIMTCIALFNVLACSGTNTNRSTLPSQTDASVASVDVSLLGLPGDAGVTSDGPTEASAPILATGVGRNGETIVPLRQGAPAPFPGVLLNGPAVARVAVEFNGQQQRCLIERQHDVALITARYVADTDSLRLALDTQRQTDEVLLNSRNDDVARLNRLLTQQASAASGPHLGEGLIWASGGLLAGVLIVGGIVIFASR